MNVDELREQFRQKNARVEASLNSCQHQGTCSPEQKIYIQQIAQSIFSEIQAIQEFLIEQAESGSR